MTSYLKINRKALVLTQCAAGTLAAILFALLFSELSYYANGGTSLFNDVLYAIIGCLFGSVAGVGLASCCCLKVKIFSRAFLTLVSGGLVGLLLGTIVCLMACLFTSSISHEVLGPEKTMRQLGALIQLLPFALPLAGTIKGFNFHLL